MTLNLLEQLKESHAKQVKRDAERDQIARNIQRFEAYNARRIRAGLEPLSLVDHICRLSGMNAAFADLDALLTDPAKPEHRDNIAMMNR